MGRKKVHLAARLVLVVDDNPDIVEVITSTLHQAGYRVRTALGQEALQIAADEHPALILLDLGLPELDGREMAQRLRADPHTRHIPIVTMSGHDPWRALAQAVGSNDHLAKPFATAHLEEIVARWATAS